MILQVRVTLQHERTFAMTYWGEVLGFLHSSLGFQTVSIKIAPPNQCFYYSLVTEILFPNAHLTERCLLL